MASEEPPPTSYWNARRGYAYYQAAVALARRHAPAARSALDVGARDTPFLEAVTWVGRKVALDQECVPRVAGAENVRGDFLTYEPPEPFDLVFCLQVLEHLDHPARFLRKLLRVGRTAVVSVPYRWPAGACEYHPQDPVDELKLQRWAGRRWADSQIVADDGRERLIAVFAGTAAGEPHPPLAAFRPARPWLPPLLEAVAAGVPRRREPFPQRRVVSVVPDWDRFAALSGGPGAYLAHVIWDALGFDDRRLLGRRFDHKLIQAAVLDHFVPGEPPRSWGLGETVRSVGPAAAIDALLTGGLFVKAAVGHLSGDDGHADATGRTLRRLWDAAEVVPAAVAPTDEEWVVQERIAVADEVRVHSFEDTVVPGLTCRRYGPPRVPDDGDRVTAYVQGVLDRLPAGLVGQSLFAWDVARTPDGRYRVIEVNVAGTHAVYSPGFQVSGFFQTHPLGPAWMARLCDFVARRYNLALRLPDDWGDFPVRYPRYDRLVRHYTSVPPAPPVPVERQPRIDGVVSVRPADLPGLELLRRSVERFGHGIGTLWVATPAEHREAVAAAVGSRGVVVPEEELVPEADPAVGRGRALARLALVSRTAGRYCLDLTPDVVCVRRFAAADLLPDGKALYFRTWYGEAERYQGVAEALGRPWPGWHHASTPFLWCRPAAEALTRHLSERSHAADGWQSYLARRLPLSVADLYFAFVESAGLDEVYYTPDSETLDGNSVWSAADWADWEPDRSFDADGPFYFSVVRPGPTVPPAAVAARLSPYLA